MLRNRFRLHAASAFPSPFTQPFSRLPLPFVNGYFLDLFLHDEAFVTHVPRPYLSLLYRVLDDYAEKRVTRV